ncbi:sensor histidine kinase [Longispora albida]|uniref:sensor histidine kinase n=1 Tax=Longispora albida TaxID=203523 RepID=UPI00036BDE55|nr:HAMP domain-containing sensor histidine kinase [Longispora albida]
MRLTARARITLLLTGLVLASGTGLTALTYLLMRRNLKQRTVFTHLDTSEPPPGAPSEAALRELADRMASDTLSALLTQAGVALVVVTVLAAVIAWRVAGRLLRPIRAISATARRLSAENLTERVPVTTPADELSALAGTVNEMLDRVQRGVDSQRLFTANAAHELRTPLTTVRTAIDVTLDGEPSRAELLTMAGDVRGAVEHLQRILDGMLSLARSQAGLGTREQVDLAVVVAGAIDAAAIRDLTVHCDLRPAPVSGEPVLLERMTGNLVDNAVRHNRPGGQLTVSTDTASGRAVLRVSNTGRDLGPAEAEALLEPFVRGAGHRLRTGGLGLGLTIVRAVAQAHQGGVSVTPRPGGGLDITVDLPGSAQPPAV